MRYSASLVRLCKQYAQVIRDIERGLCRDEAAEKDFERSELHHRIRDLMCRLHIATDYDDVHALALDIAKNE